MNIKLISVVSALAVSAAVAQDYDDEYEESTSSTESAQEEAPAAPAPEPAPAAEESSTSSSFEAPAASENVPTPAAAGTFNVLHGNAYNMVGNQFGASTIDGDMEAVYKMNGRKLFYVEPSGEEGVLALGSSGMTYLLAFDNNTTHKTNVTPAGVNHRGDYVNMGLLTAGIATTSTWVC